MDEIECNLKSENPILISHAISILSEIIKKKYDTSEEKDISRILEFKFLTSKCINHENLTVITSTCQGLVTLVEGGLWNAKSALATLTSMCTSKNYEAIIVAISQLLILDWKTCNGCSEYTLELPNQHPFIIILKQNKHSGICVVNQMKQIMYDDEECVMEHSIEILRPVFLYIICNPVIMEVVDNAKSEAWQLVIKSSKAADLQMEILLWLCTSRESICVDSNCRLIELAETSMKKKNTEYCTALAPLIASVTIQLLEYKHNPANNFSMLLRLIRHCDNHIGNLMISLMTEIILICPDAYLSKAFRICEFIVEHMSYDIIFLNVLSVPLLTWLVYKTPLKVFKNLLIVIKQQQTRNTMKQQTGSISDAAAANKVLRMISRNNKYILFYTEQIRNLHSLNNDVTPWLENLSLAPIDLKYNCKLILCAIFLHSEESLVVRKTYDILLNIAKQIKSFESYVMSLVNHKLTVFHDSSSTLELLKAFPQLGSTRVVANTLKSMQNSERPLSDVTFEFYIKAIENNPRCYRFLSTALMEKLEQNSTLNDWRTDVVCANTIKRICEGQPEHGEELVPMLSLILNRCTDANGGAASALALDAISSLCKGAVIGIYSTWQVLAPKMRAEKRTAVLESLCDLFANIPSFPFRANDDHDKFITEVVTELWRYTIGENTRVAEAAFKALKSYPLELVPPSTLPPDFRSDLVIPSKEPDKSDKPEDTLQYIPGSCWIQMLKKISRNLLPAARDLLIFYIENELTGFRSRIYTWPQGEPQNFKFLPERSVIRAIGEHLRRSDKTDPSNQNVIECLRIFSYNYKKPLPNIKWDFLEEIMKISDEAKEYSLLIISRHCQISQSAKSLTERFLSMHTSTSKTGQLLLNEKHLAFYSHLDKLCQAFQPNSLQQFLETSIDYFIDRILQNDEKSIDSFSWIMSSYGTALKSDMIHIGNRMLLSTLMEKIFEIVELTPKQDFSIFEIYYAALMQLTVKDIERITSPSIWWTETAKKLRNAITVRTKLAFSGNFPGTPVAWLSEIIETATCSLEMQKHFLESMQRVQTDLRLNQSFDLASQKDWILDFMSRIVLVMSEKNNVTTFYLDILFVSVICLSGMDCLLSKKELLITSQDDRIRLFPLAISVLIDRQIWKSASFQIMKWLNYMRINCLIIPDVYIPAFQSALILLKGEEDYSLQWTNYLSSKTYIDS